MKVSDISFGFIFSGLLLLVSSCVVAAPERLCEIRQSAWCLLEGAEKIIDEKTETDSKYASVWYVSGPLDQNHGFYVLEPNGCRKGLSDSLNLVNYNDQVEWRNQQWRKIIFRLKNDESCDLEVLLPSAEIDKLGEAFSHTFLLIKSCNSNACGGYVVGEKVSPNELKKFDRNLGSK
ncbi:MAG TPA: hypothetical protein PK002_08415 [Cellvibrio sp.]|nr:hypothetical protein [Cellvibrio sp.]